MSPRPAVRWLWLPLMVTVIVSLGPSGSRGHAQMSGLDILSSMTINSLGSSLNKRCESYEKALRGAIMSTSTGANKEQYISVPRDQIFSAILHEYEAELAEEAKQRPEPGTTLDPKPRPTADESRVLSDLKDCIEYDLAKQARWRPIDGDRSAARPSPAESETLPSKGSESDSTQVPASQQSGSEALTFSSNDMYELSKTYQETKSLPLADSCGKFEEKLRTIFESKDAGLNQLSRPEIFRRMLNYLSSRRMPFGNKQPAQIALQSCVDQLPSYRHEAGQPPARTIISGPPSGGHGGPAGPQVDPMSAAKQEFHEVKNRVKDFGQDLYHPDSKTDRASGNRELPLSETMADGRVRFLESELEKERKLAREREAHNKELEQLLADFQRRAAEDQAELELKGDVVARPTEAIRQVEAGQQELGALKEQLKVLQAEIKSQSAAKDLGPLEVVRLKKLALISQRAEQLSDGLNERFEAILEDLSEPAASEDTVTSWFEDVVSRKSDSQADDEDDINDHATLHRNHEIDRSESGDGADDEGDSDEKSRSDTGGESELNEADEGDSHEVVDEDESGDESGSGGAERQISDDKKERKTKVKKDKKQTKKDKKAKKDSEEALKTKEEIARRLQDQMDTSESLEGRCTKYYMALNHPGKVTKKFIKGLAEMNFPLTLSRDQAYYENLAKHAHSLSQADHPGARQAALEIERCLTAGREPNQPQQRTYSDYYEIPAEGPNGVPISVHRKRVETEPVHHFSRSFAQASAGPGAGAMASAGFWSNNQGPPRYSTTMTKRQSTWSDQHSSIPPMPSWPGER